MKANKLARAEFGKLFMRPAIYFMTAFLVIALVLATLLYTPTVRENSNVNFNSLNQTVSDIYSAFNDETSTSTNSKVVIDTAFLNTYKQIATFNSSSNTLNAIIEKAQHIDSFLDESSGTSFYNLLKMLANNQNDSSVKANFVNSLLQLKTMVYEINNFLGNEVNSQTIDFYITISEYEEINRFFQSFYDVIPREAVLSEHQAEELIHLGNLIVEKYMLDEVIAQLSSYEKIQLDQEKFDALKVEYFLPIATNEMRVAIGEEQTENENTSIMDDLYSQITAFVKEKSDSTKPEDIDTINLLITKYKNVSKIGAVLLDTSFQLSKNQGKSDVSIGAYMGFSDFNSYALKESMLLNDYLLENSIFDGKYYNNLSFSQTMGTVPTAFDFAFYSMQILTIIITVFCIFFVVSGIAGEQSGGTMKMIATRPFRKTKIITGKLLSCFYFMLMFLPIATVASVVVGAAQFGFGANYNVIMIFNAQFVIAVPSVIAFLIYLLTLIVSTFFFVALACFISVIFSSTAFATFTTFIIYLVGIIFNSLFALNSWYPFMPFAHLDLFRYFGGAETSPVFLGINLTLDANFFISLAVSVGSIFILILSSKLIFKKKDIS